MQKKNATLIIVSVVIVFIAIIAVFAIRAEHSSTGAQANSPAPVALAQVTKHNIPLRATAIGTLIAPNTIMLKAQQAGNIKAIYFKPGQHVQKGQRLLQIDPATEIANLQEKKAAYNQLKAQYQRYKTMSHVDQGSVSAEILDEKYSAMKVAKAQMNAASTALNNTEIRAPFSGVMGALQTLNGNSSLSALSETNTLIALGSYLQVGDSIAIITDPNSLIVQYQLPQSVGPHLKLAQSVSILTTAYPNKTFPGVVTYISPVILQTGYVYTIRAKIQSHQDMLTPGMKVLATQTLMPQRLVLAVPGISLLPSLNGYSVGMVVHGKVKTIPVTIGQRFGDWVEITKGLAAGDKIIVQGLAQIDAGSSVKVVSK